MRLSVASGRNLHAAGGRLRGREGIELSARESLHYAIVVGINRYPGIGDLTGARKDAQEFAKWLTDNDGGGLPARNVRKVYVTRKEEAAYARPEDARPIQNEIDYALEFLRDDVRENLQAEPDAWDRTRLYIYVAGHGFAPPYGEGALFLADANKDALSRNIELAEYRRWCTTCAYFREVIVFADCCRTRFRAGTRGYGPRLDECAEPWNGKSSTWLVGYGTTLGKPTYELPAAEASDDDARGYFTRALLDGLRGAARDDAGAITAASLSGYVRSLVAEQTRDQPFPQDAQIHGALGEEIRFGSTKPPATRAVTLVLPSGLAGTATLSRDGRELAVWNGGRREWKHELPDGIYEVSAEGRELENGGLFKVAGKGRRVEL